MAKWNWPVLQEMLVQSLGQEDSPKKEMATHSCSCLENPMDRILAAYNSFGHKRVGNNLVSGKQLGD